MAPSYKLHGYFSDIPCSSLVEISQTENRSTTLPDQITIEDSCITTNLYSSWCAARKVSERF